MPSLPPCSWWLLPLRPLVHHSLVMGCPSLFCYLVIVTHCHHFLIGRSIQTVRFPGFKSWGWIVGYYLETVVSSIILKPSVILHNHCVWLKRAHQSFVLLWWLFLFPKQPGLLSLLCIFLILLIKINTHFIKANIHLNKEIQPQCLWMPFDDRGFQGNRPSGPTSKLLPHKYYFCIFSYKRIKIGKILSSNLTNLLHHLRADERQTRLSMMNEMSVCAKGYLGRRLHNSPLTVIPHSKAWPLPLP